MKGVSLMKLSCKEAAKVCTKAEYKEADLLEKLRLKLHLILCSTCNNYYQKNRKLSGLIKKADIKPCSAEQKNIFKEQLKNGNSKTSKD